MEIVLATSNPNKLREIEEICNPNNIKFILPSKDFSPVENGKDFEENSLIKARAAWELSKTWSLADDSGLCIDYLDGKPGIYSARYAETPQKRIERVLWELSEADTRKAHFSCAMTLINPKGEVEYKCVGVCNGSIIKETKGTNGFGYDPIFLPDGSTETMAELSEEEKNKISHRSVALTKMIDYISKNLK